MVRGSVAVRESMSQPRLGAVFHVFLHFSVRDFGKARGEFELDDDVGAEGEEAAWGFRYGAAPVVSRPSL